jgi:hypothetical protein
MAETNLQVNSCFVISPIGADDSDTRKRADKVLKHIFKASLEPLGYTVVRADEISQPGSITLQVLERVLESNLVIADLTDHNPNVFYELAVRHATQKPVIHVIDHSQKIPFDIADLRAVALELDLDGAERAKREIVAQVQQIEKGHLGETPVKLAGVLKHLESGKSEEKLVLRQILESVSELRSELRLNFDRSAMEIDRNTMQLADLLIRGFEGERTVGLSKWIEFAHRGRESDLDEEALIWFTALGKPLKEELLKEIERRVASSGISRQKAVKDVIQEYFMEGVLETDAAHKKLRTDKKRT